MNQPKASALKQRLISATATALQAHGANGLKARPIAEAAECAVGSIYKSFPSLEALADVVITGCFERLGARLTQMMSSRPSGESQIHQMANAYLEFARDEGALWSAIFELPSQEGTLEGDARRAALQNVFDLARSAIGHTVSSDRIEDVTLMIWAALHGLSHLTVTKALGGVDAQTPFRLADEMITAILAAETPNGETDGNR